MNAEQRTAALALLQFVMSEVGYRKVTNIRRLEEVLRQMGSSPLFCTPSNTLFVGTRQPHFGDGASRVIIFP